MNPSSHLVSVFLPEPVNIYLANNTFVKFGNCGNIGMVVNINLSERQCTLHHFLSLQQLQQHLGDNLPPNINFWPDQSTYPPFILFDSDITSTVFFTQVIGLAFVFHEDDVVVRQI